MTEIYGIWDAMSTIDCIMKERAAMSSKVRFQNGAWRLIVAQMTFGQRSRCARFLPISHPNRCLRRVCIAPVRIRPLSAGNGSSASAARPPSPTRVWPDSSGVCVMVGLYQPARPSASSWSASRGSFALRLPTHACPNCYDSGAYFQIEKCCGWAYTVIALPVAVRYSRNSPWRTRLHPVRPI